MKILFAGGGTMGSVTPLLAVAKQLEMRGHQIVFVGTKTGPERAVVEGMGIPFFAIPSAKIPRYLTPALLWVPVQVGLAKLAALRVLRAERPDVIVSAGGYVAVPLGWVGRWWLGIPSVLHQQDVQVTLSNRILTPCAKAITTAFESSVRQFRATPTRSVEWIGNPVRDLTPTTTTLSSILDKALPTVLIMGGGTGARGINALVTDALCHFANVIHITGKGKAEATSTIQHSRYHAFEFLDAEMKEALACADVVVSRAGLGSITELSTLGKPTLFIPMPQSHQEQNAGLIEQHKAGVVLSQNELTPESFTKAVQALVQHPTIQKEVSAGIRGLFPAGANEAFMQTIEKVGKA